MTATTERPTIDAVEIDSPNGGTVYPVDVYLTVNPFETADAIDVIAFLHLSEEDLDKLREHTSDPDNDEAGLEVRDDFSGAVFEVYAEAGCLWATAMRAA